MKNTLKLLLLLLVFWSCSNENESIPKENAAVQSNLSLKEGLPPATAVPNVYSVYTSNTSGTDATIQRAKLCINNIISDLSSNPSGANTVSVSNLGDIYVGGTESIDNQNYSGKVWKNGQNYFTSTVFNKSVNSIFTKGNDVYFNSGNDIYKNNNYLYTLTSTSNQCPYGTSQISFTDIYVNNSDVYVGGVFTGCFGYFAVALWKNGILLNYFPSSTSFFPQWPITTGASVYVDSSNIYVSGILDGQATIWKNGVPRTLPSFNGYESFCKSITGDANFVYVVGGTLPTATVGASSSGRLWKINKSTNVITTERTYNGLRTGVYNNSGITYTSGWEKVWKENQLIVNVPNTFINSVFVK